MFRRLGSGLVLVATRIGQAQAWALFTLFYLVILAPVALVFKVVADPLQMKQSNRSIWHTTTQSRDRRKWANAQC